MPSDTPPLSCYSPSVLQLGLPALLVVRALMGIGEGVAMPAMNTLLSRYGAAEWT
jgi:MFS family permease